jgi:hydrogenase maturation protein HypF
MDGTGLGEDGHIWGGEFLLCDLLDYSRFTHFDYIPLPGGDKVTKEPWRTAVSYLYKYVGRSFLELDLPFVRSLDRAKVQFVLKAIDKKINSPLSCSAGRLFDAVAALTGLCLDTKFHAEAPMRLEAIAEERNEEFYPCDFKDTISFGPTFKSIINDLQNKTNPPIISGRFHNTFLRVILETAVRMREETGVEKVVLSGGTFQNRFILERVETRLEQKGFQVFSQQRVPSNDGGIALGQIAIAAKRRERGHPSVVINKKNQ